MKEVFLCHAGEDKAAVVRPLFQALKGAGISCWLDEAEIHWGDSITAKVNEGLDIARFVIVVLSPAFLGKHWPQRELNAVLNREASTGEVRVLPLLVGNQAEKREILNQFPLLNDKLYLSWEDPPAPIVTALQKRLGGTPIALAVEETAAAGTGFGRSIHLPKLRKRLTQRDRDLFVKQVFGEVKSYFGQALAQLEQHYPDVETDFTEIHAFKFTAKIYVNGEAKAQCKIWMGGIAGPNSIAYSWGSTNISNDNSSNGWLSVEEDGSELSLSLPMSGFTLPEQETKHLNPEQAAAALWKMFTHNLEQ